MFKYYVKWDSVYENLNNGGGACSKMWINFVRVLFYKLQNVAQGGIWSLVPVIQIKSVSLVEVIGQVLRAIQSSLMVFKWAMDVLFSFEHYTVPKDHKS